MVFTKDELIGSLKNEIRILLHLIGKLRTEDLEFKPTPGQRSTLELLRYIAMFGPIHLRGVLAESWNMESWRETWTNEQTKTSSWGLDETRSAIAAHEQLFEDLLRSIPDERLREPLEMFGIPSTRGAMAVMLVLNHYVAYRMQLFLYLKGCGHQELGTMNLWVGRDASAAA
jgi:uncharacterized damage-inducible protein DinB